MHARKGAPLPSITAVSTWTDLFAAWRTSDGEGRRILEPDLEALRLRVWKRGGRNRKDEILWFLANASIEGVQHLIWDALREDDPRLIGDALGAAVVSVTRADWEIRDEDIAVLWQVLRDSRVKQRATALVILDLVGRAYNQGELVEIVNTDPDPYLRERCANVLKTGPVPSILVRYRS